MSIGVDDMTDLVVDNAVLIGRVFLAVCIAITVYGVLRHYYKKYF